jgi:para-aminobenzoate synthetase component 1
VRRRIAAGTVYQVNLCRVLEHDLPEDARISALGARLSRGNPAPYAATLDLPEAGLEIACASPEAYLVRRGDRVTSRPIKGTAPTAGELLPKDYAENVMIVDLVRHDLGHVSLPGTVEVDHLCRVEEHPGLVHLVSDVSGTLRDGTTWSHLFDASFPPGSVSGAPKHTALRAIADLEPVPRGPYCGAVGWVDADRDEAELAVGIRTFWVDRDDAGRRVLRFGTGAGITWGSDAEGEWRETELKAARLVALASGNAPVVRGWAHD